MTSNIMNKTKRLLLSSALFISTSVCASESVTVIHDGEQRPLGLEFFTDVSPSTDTLIENLNGQGDTQAKLRELSDYITSMLTTPKVDVVTNVAGLNIDLGDLAYFTANKALVHDLTGEVYEAGESIRSKGHFIARNVEPNENIEISFYDELALSTQYQVNFEDKIGPVVILQDNFSLSDVYEEQYPKVYSVGGALGAPQIWLQPKFLWDGRSNRTSVFSSLTDLSARERHNGILNLPDDAIMFARPTYDALAWQNWPAKSATIHVSMSEDLNLVSSTPVHHGAPVLSNWQVHNDYIWKLNFSDGQRAYTQDALSFDVDDFMALANDRSNLHGTSINTASVVSDVFGNNSQFDPYGNVVIRDAMPPMVTKAWLDYNLLYVQFNEAININKETYISFVSLNTGEIKKLIIDPDASRGMVGDFQLSDDNTELILKVSSERIRPIFDSFSWKYIDTEKPWDAKHAVLRWDMISDYSGNNWNRFTPNGADEGGLDRSVGNLDLPYQVNGPQFLVPTYNGQSQIGYVYSNAGKVDIGDIEYNRLAVSISFSHGVDISKQDTNGNGYLDGKEFDSLISIDFNPTTISGYIKQFGHSSFNFAQFSDDNRTLQLQIVAPSSLGDNIKLMLRGFESQFDDSTIISSLNVDFNSLTGQDLDFDNDGILNADDNCPSIENPEQVDDNLNHVGDLCEFDLLSIPNDADLDGIINADDNCPQVSNVGQWDKDRDGFGNACDEDIDGDGFDNQVEERAGTKAWDENSFPLGDSDNDGLDDAIDNCIDVANIGQWDKDNDGIGNECDDDIDGDGVSNGDEIADGTKPWDPSSYLRDSSPDDLDGDGILNRTDNCPNIANAGQWDKDKDQIGNECDNDIDGDGFSNEEELIAGSKVWDPESRPGQL